MNDKALQPFDPYKDETPGKNLPARIGSALMAPWKAGEESYAEFLPGALAVTETRPSPAAAMTIWIISASLVIFLLWAALAKVDQSVVGQGKVRPYSHVQVINHSVGGRIKDIHVHAGDEVKAGQKLLSLDPELIDTEVSKLSSQVATRRAETARLEAEAEGKSTMEAPEDLVRAYPDVVANQRLLLESRRLVREQKLASARNIVEQRASDVTQAESALRNARKGLSLAQEQGKAIAELTEKGYFPRVRALQVERDTVQQKGEFERAQSMLESAQAAKASADAELEKAANDDRSQVLNSLSETRTERDRLQNQLTQVITQQKNLDLISPVDGFVENLAATNIGQVVQSGEAIMRIVPSEERLVVDARIANRDIGRIKPGQAVRLKIHAFDYARYGSINGHVIRVAHDSQANDRTDKSSSEAGAQLPPGLFYTVEIEPEHMYVGSHPDSTHRLRPGMTLDAELHTGRRSILGYLLDAMLRTTDEAMREN
ncbi:MAG: HlyD family type I secretion periplasmic adaptor subunit [Alphaproteobacteria bacterium]|nr:MAG: HlyD family type I secretion periplasmic adaptor subunit [Alphaproteobacteria bacterium]